MRVILGCLGLVLALFVVMQLVKTQTTPLAPVRPPGAAPVAGDPPALQGRPQQVQDQYRQALDDALKAGQQRMESAEKP
jgi:hypothetical protein